MSQLCDTVSRNIAPFISGDLDTRKSNAVREHMRKCEKCRRSLTDFRRVWEALDGWEDVEPPESLVLEYPRVGPEAVPVRRLFKLAVATVIIIGVLACISLWFVGIPAGGWGGVKGLPLIAGEVVEINRGQRRELRVGRGSAITLSGPARLVCKQLGEDAVLTLHLGTVDVSKRRSLTSLTVEIPNGVVRAEGGCKFRVAVYEPRAEQSAHLRLMNIEAAALIRAYSNRVSVENFFAGKENVEEGETHIVTYFADSGRVEGFLKGSITERGAEGEMRWGAHLDIPELGHTYFFFPTRSSTSLRAQTARLESGQPLSIDYERAQGKLWVSVMRKLNRSPRAVFRTDVFFHAGEAEIGSAEARHISAVLDHLDRASEWSDFVAVIGSQADAVGKLQFAVRVLADWLDRGKAAYEATKAIRIAVENLKKSSLPADVYPTLYRTLELRSDPGAWLETLELLGELRDGYAPRRIRSAMRRFKEQRNYPERVHRCINGKWRMQEYDRESTKTAVLQAAQRTLSLID